jgi:hypothetical protein
MTESWIPNLSISTFPSPLNVLYKGFQKIESRLLTLRPRLCISNATEPSVHLPTSSARLELRVFGSVIDAVKHIASDVPDLSSLPRIPARRCDVMEMIQKKEPENWASKSHNIEDQFFKALQIPPNLTPRLDFDLPSLHSISYNRLVNYEELDIDLKAIDLLAPKFEEVDAQNDSIMAETALTYRVFLLQNIA